LLVKNKGYVGAVRSPSRESLDLLELWLQLRPQIMYPFCCKGVSEETSERSPPRRPENIFNNPIFCENNQEKCNDRLELNTVLERRRLVCGNSRSLFDYTDALSI
jgi:hypothetical protein